jgi:alkylation response protein AidB-like acyl-CoA dehydrogenase
MDARRRLPERIGRGSQRAWRFRMAVPRASGGFELYPMTQVRVVEELLRMDVSVGWCDDLDAGSLAPSFLPPWRNACAATGTFL